LRSEPNIRAKRDAQLVVRAAVEINIIADVQAQADRTKMTFKAAARIQHAVDVCGAQGFDGALEGIEGRGPE